MTLTERANRFAHAYVETKHSPSSVSDFQAAMNIAVAKAAAAAYEKAWRDCTEEAADWIKENAKGYMCLDSEYEDAPQEILMSEYCVPSFKMDMIGEE